MNLYWDAFSGFERNGSWISIELWTDKDRHWISDILQGQLNFVFIILPVTVLWLPTIFIYVRIIQVPCKVLGSHGMVTMIHDQPSWMIKITSFSTAQYKY